MTGLELVMFSVTVVAAIVYLVIEACYGERWWRTRRHRKQPPPESKVRPLGESWSDEARAKAEQRWDEIVEAGQKANEGEESE